MNRNPSSRTSRFCLTILALGLTPGLSPADTYRFNSAVSSDWMNGQNWQNQTTGTNGWLVGGIPLPGAADTVRFNYANSAGTLSANAGTVDALQLAVDEGGSLTLSTGATLTTDTGNWSGIGAGSASNGTLIINDGLLTINNGWEMGTNASVHNATLEINGGEMRVVSGGFIQDTATTTSLTTINDGLLHVNSLNLSTGVIDVAGGTLKIDGNHISAVASWETAGLMKANGGAAGSSLDTNFTAGITTITATTTTPPGPGSTYAATPTVSGPGSEGYHTNGSALGKSVWIADNMLYFNIPNGEFPVGDPVYVQIEYLDVDHGHLRVKYDSDYGSTIEDIFRQSEIHTRSSRVDRGGFAFSYHEFENPLFANRQNGGNDFRIELAENNGSPFQVASVLLSSTPFAVPDFQYSLTRPWLQPYTGITKDLTDPNTTAGKVMTGYQGWFATPNDLDDAGWTHWGRSSGVDPSPTEITIDSWPWINEYDPSRIYPAGDMTLGDGRPAYLFSSRDPESVQRHFRWMRKHDIDGAYLQRFVSRSSSGYYGSSEFVLDNVRKAANKEGRVWAIEYDVSSMANDADPFEVISNDWNWLVTECDILNDPRYLHENGKPVLFIWGFSVPGREGLSLTEANTILDWFNTQNLYLIGGVHSTWLGNTAWHGHYQKYDQLLAWMERTHGDLVSQKAQLDSWGMKILPHAWPGFSWHNLKKLVPDTQYTARAGGDFYWDRLYNAVSIGADQIFLGMFDEYDEGTAIMPMSDNHPAPHTAWGKYIDNEGFDPFYYLQLSGAAREMLNGFRTLSSSTPSPASLTPPAFGGDDATIHLGASNVVSGLDHPNPPDGITTSAVVGGHDCRINNSGSYFYFDIDDFLCFAKSNGQNATIEIEFYDNSPGTTISLQYDGLGSAYTTHPDSTDLPDTLGWKIIRWNVADGFFGNQQNGSSDFRIGLSGGAQLSLRRVSVFLPEDEGGPLTGLGPVAEYINDGLEWPVEYDALGWRLFLSPDLKQSSWFEAPTPTFSNGKARYELNYSQLMEFYRLQKPATR